MDILFRNPQRFCGRYLVDGQQGNPSDACVFLMGIA
jgi:hypothetical protein